MAAQYDEQMETVEEYSYKGKLVRKLYVFYELTSASAAGLPQQLGLYILPPAGTTGTDDGEADYVISSDTVDMGVPTSRRRRWAMVSTNTVSMGSKPDVGSVTEWSWHTQGAGYMLESDSAYEPACESFIRQFIK